MHPLSIARILWKHKLLVGVAWLAATAIGVTIVQLLPTRYRAESLILVNSQKIPDRYVSSTVNQDLQDRLASIRQQILSTTKLKKIIDDFDLYHAEKKNHVQEEIIEMMRKDIEMRLERGWTETHPGAFRVAYTGSVPATVAEVANRIANLFIEENLRNREVQAVGTSEFIENQLNDAKKKLDQLEVSVSRYKLQHNGELPQQEQALMGALARLQLELQGNQDGINRAQQNKVILENSLSMAEATESAIMNAREAARKAAESAAARGASSTAVTLPGGQPKPRKRSEILQEQLEQLRVRYSDDHPDVKRALEDLERTKASEAQEDAKEAEAEKVEAAASTPAGGEGAAQNTASRRAAVKTPELAPEAMRELVHARERISTLKAQLKLNSEDLDQRAADRKQILANIASYQKRLNTLPVREQEMASILRDYEISKANYRSLLEKKQSAEMATEMERRQKSERFDVLDPARVPELPFSPNRVLLRMVSAGIALVLALAVSVAKELPRGPLLGEWELPPDVPVLARVPKIEFEQAAEGKRKRAPRLWRWRLALVSSAVLGVIAAGVYLAWRRF